MTGCESIESLFLLAQSLEIDFRELFNEGWRKWKLGNWWQVSWVKSMAAVRAVTEWRSLSVSRWVIILVAQASNICAGAALLWKASKSIDSAGPEGRKKHIYVEITNILLALAARTLPLPSFVRLMDRGRPSAISRWLNTHCVAWAVWWIITLPLITVIASLPAAWRERRNFAPALLLWSSSWQPNMEPANGAPQCWTMTISLKIEHMLRITFYDMSNGSYLYKKCWKWVRLEKWNAEPGVYHNWTNGAI